MRQIIIGVVLVWRMPRICATRIALAAHRVNVRTEKSAFSMCEFSTITQIIDGNLYAIQWSVNNITQQVKI
jgi:hypothetical protein